MNRRRFLATLGLLPAARRWRRLDIEPFDEILPARYPYLQNVQADKATIMWAALEGAAGGVQYTVDGINFGTAAAKRSLFRPAETGLLAPLFQYQADLTGLSPGTAYSYQCFVGGVSVAAGGESILRTAGPGPFNFFVLGDSGVGDSGFGNKDNQFLIARQMLLERPALVIHTGDVVYPQGTYQTYGLNYFNYYYASMASVPFFPTPGNHDYEVQNAAAYLAVHSVPGDTVPVADRGRYYSFDWGNVHFVSLDSNLSLERAVTSGGPMLEWLNNDLRSTRQFWRVVYFHHPPYGAGPNQNDVHSLWIRQYAVPIFEANGVQLVLNGHEHSYQRSQSIRKSAVAAIDTATTYLVSGGGGAFLYPVFDSPFVAAGRSTHHHLRVEVRGTRMTVHAIRFDGVEIDSFTLAPQPAFGDDPNTKPVSFQPAPTAGALVRIAGRALAPEEASVCTPALPTELSETSVTINGRPISLLYVSGSQIYGQLPFTVDGNITVRVTTAFSCYHAVFVSLCLCGS
ncbi:MAG: hypothetical protein DMG13_05710 [Acidobacteria bacterium]|nr:MAG: hypothetical protein DMG13_05710 [Acidobacteriota bacterium]